MFGATEDAGFITFHDAWITPSSLNGSLVREVITPHHKDYYMPKDVRLAPTDFDSPVPVTFLAVKGEFEIRVNCDGGVKGKDWEDLALELLRQALENWGVGGKTNSGYGRGSLSNASGAGNKTNTVSAGVSQLASLFAPGQKIEARVASINKKGNPQFDAVFLDGKEIKISGRWEGTKREWKKGDRVSATVKGYIQNDKSPLVLTD
jgi:hypothetical protein